MGNEEWPWSNEQKRKYVWGHLTETAQKAGSNTASYFAYIVQNDGEYEPVFLDRSEQFTILQDFALEGKIKLIGKRIDKDFTYDFELLEPKRFRSPYSDHISTIADLVKDTALRNRLMKIITKAFGVIDAREIKAKHTVESDVHETDDGHILLMDELGLTETNWESLKQQTHRMVGNRYIRVTFKGEMIKKLVDAMFGRSSVINIKAIDQIASLTKDLMSQDKLNDFFIQVGVPTSLLLDNQNSKHDLVYNVILALSSTGEQEDKNLLDHILEELAHPLTFHGNTKNAVDFQYKITKVIRYDGFSLLGGKIHGFEEADEIKISELEKNHNEVDLALVESVNSIFGGDAFGNFAPRRAVIKNPQQEHQVETKKVEPQAMHVHIYNDNKNIQNTQIPRSAPNQTSAHIDTKEQTKTPQGIAPNLKWEQIEIKFNNGNDVTISYGDKQLQSNYVTMDFEDAKKRMPNMQWKILQHMAKHERYISFENSKSITNDLKSQKKEMSQKLQKYFGIKGDPFVYIKSEVGSGYMAIFDLRPDVEIPKSYLGSIE